MIWGNKIKTLDMVSIHLQKVKLTLSIVIWRLICVHNLKSHSRAFYIWLARSPDYMLSMFGCPIQLEKI